MLVKQFFRDSFWYALGLMGVAAIELLRVPLVGRLIGPEKFGHFALAYGLVALAATAASSWLTTAIVRFLPGYDVIGAKGAGNRLVIRLAAITIGSVVFMCAIAGWIVGGRLEHSLQVLVLPGVVLVATMSSDRIFLSVLRARRQTSIYASYAFSQAALGLVVGLIWASIVAGGARELLFSMALISCLLLPVAWGFCARSASDCASDAPIPSPSREWWRYGLPLLGVNVLSWVLSNLDRYALQWAGRSAEVGPYAAVHYISERVIFVLTYLISMGVAPIIFAAWERKKKDDVQQFLSQLVAFVLLAGMPICALLFCDDSGVFLRHLLPTSFSGAFSIMPIISAAALLLCIGNIYSEIFTLHKQPLYLLLCYLLAAVTKVIVLVAFVPQLGMKACAGGTAIAYGMFMFLVVTTSGSLMKVQWRWKSFARILVAAVGMAVVAHRGLPLVSESFWRFGVWVGISFGCYLAILLLLREPSIRTVVKLLRAPLLVCFNRK